MTSSENVAIALCGMSPAVITELIYHLSHETPPFIPDKIVAIATTEARDAIVSELFESGTWERLRKTLNVPSEKLQFGPSSDCVRLINADNHRSDAVDVTTTADAVRAADFILNVLRQFTENPDTRIVFSVAGGRKTMSALAALCMTLIGREQDRLCHVLVNPPFDDPRLEPKFYFPLDPLAHHSLNGERVTVEPEITVSDIPFVKCRTLFKRHFDRLPGSYSNLVGLANQALTDFKEALNLRIIPKNGECWIDGQRIQLGKTEFVLYWCLAARRKAGEPPISGLDELQRVVTEFANAVEQSQMTSILFVKDTLNKENITPDDFRKFPSRVKRAVTRTLGEDFRVRPCLPTARRGIYGLELPPENIELPSRWTSEDV